MTAGIAWSAHAGPVWLASNVQRGVVQGSVLLVDVVGLGRAALVAVVVDEVVAGVVVVEDRNVLVVVVDVVEGCVVLVLVVRRWVVVVRVVVDVVIVLGRQWSMPSHAPPEHGLPAAANWQAAVQHDVCLPLAAPSSHSSPGCTIPSPQPGIATSVTLLSRCASGRTFSGSITTRSRKARVVMPGTSVASIYWHARDGS